MSKCGVCDLEYYEECECISCVVCDEPTKLEEMEGAMCKTCRQVKKLVGDA